jgi:peptidyl-tRNA hydrolase
VQSAHAAIDFQHEHPEEARQWQTKSNYLALLTVANEEELIKLITKAIFMGIKHTIFREPDLGNEITAVAFEPTDVAKKLTSSCPLLGKEVCYA